MKSGNGQFEGRFLVAMPGMNASIFAESVVYLCAHSDEGAMGFVLNKPADMTLAELIGHTDFGKAAVLDKTRINRAAGPVRIGGPVDEHRGFVLHSHDYAIEATIPLSEAICLTSTVDILKSIVAGEGPAQAAIALGYAGWGAGQLEQEIRDNAWLTMDADPDIVFAHDHDEKYPAMIGRLGIGAANFIPEGGRA
ncbi:MAG: YqgE/AlgH family protein [Phyllobacteriaceae bacterium]|nr:YqgE/AlgH family protein [Phyllobacteriaceae bacterium]